MAPIEVFYSASAALEIPSPRPRGTEFLNYEAHLHGACSEVRASQFLQVHGVGTRPLRYHSFTPNAWKSFHWPQMKQETANKLISPSEREYSNHAILMHVRTHSTYIYIYIYAYTIHPFVHT